MSTRSDRSRLSGKGAAQTTESTIDIVSMAQLEHSEGLEIQPSSMFTANGVPNTSEKLPDTPKIGNTLLFIVKVENHIKTFFHTYSRYFKWAIWTIIFLLYNGGLVYACVRDYQKAKTLLILTIVVYCCVIYFNFISKPLASHLTLWTKPLRGFLRKHRKNRRRIQAALFFVAVGIFLGVDSASDPSRLQSLAGVASIILFGWIISKYPARVPWYTVLWGIAVQVVFALVILRWDAGRSVFEWIGEMFQGLIQFTDAGAEFVFGKNFRDHFFAFAVMPVIVFFGFLIAALYYWGAMQFAIAKIGWLLNVTLGTTACESFCAAANIFVGMTEAPLMVRPYLERMTPSELHTLFTGGFANVAGSVLAAYISFGVSAVHLLSASVMSAPCSLALSKLVYPETEVSQTGFDQITVDSRPEHNVLEAATLGAQSTVKLVSYIIANILSCLAAIHLFNWLINYLGSLVGIAGLSFELIAGYIFMPLAWAMGTEWKECKQVGQLVGIKTVLNEFIAYVKLGEMIKNNTLSVKGQLVATYALCGFSNIGSLGIMIGGMSVMAPGRRTTIVSVGLRSLITGCMSCFLTASLAALLVDTSIERSGASPLLLNGRLGNTTSTLRTFNTSSSL